MAIKKTLASSIARIIEIKHDLIKVNPRFNSDYVYLDKLLYDLKLSPDCLTIPIPK